MELAITDWSLVRSREVKPAIIARALADPSHSVRLLGELSLYELVKCFWSEISDDEFQDNWHIPVLCSELEKIAEHVALNQPKLYDLIINIPPGTTKTIIVSIMFPVWCWTRWYWMRFITGSHTEALALESADKCRDILRCDKFRVMYPEIGIAPGKDVKSIFRVQKKEYVHLSRVPRTYIGGGRYSTSVGAKIVGFHAHIIIVDDPIDPKGARSDTELNDANQWMDQELSTRKTDKAVTPTILIMQRLHDDDPSGHILKKKKSNVKHICLPGVLRWGDASYEEQVIPASFMHRYRRGLLDPVRMSMRVLEDLEADLGQYGFSGQIGQKPTPPGGGMFRVDHLMTILIMPAAEKIEQTIRYWDKAGTSEKELKRGQNAAYTAGVKMHKLNNGVYIVSDVKRGRWASDEREDIIRATAEADGEDVMTYIEQEPGSGGKESAQATIRNLAGFFVDTDRPAGDKTRRADTFSVQVNKGNVFLLHGEWNSAYVHELEGFPFGRFKDQVDASSGAFNILSGRRVARMITRSLHQTA